MTNDIVTALWRIAEDCQCDCWICDTAAKGANEIEQLRIKLQIAVGLLSASSEFSKIHPEQVMQMIEDEIPYVS